MIKYQKNNDLTYRQWHPQAYQMLIKATEWCRGQSIAHAEALAIERKEHRRILKKGPKRF